MTRPRGVGLGRRAALLGLGGAVSGCGFHPIYAPRSDQPGGSQSQLAAIRVAPTGDRAGQLLRQELQARFDHGEALAKRYELVAAFALTEDLVGIQSDTSATRLRFIASASWSLRTLSTAPVVLTSGTSRSLDGANIIDQQYFELDLAGETVTRRLAASLADQITIQVAAYFARTPAAG
jgi:LPS-assembly lipoprotein